MSRLHIVQQYGMQDKRSRLVVFRDATSGAVTIKDEVILLGEAK